MDDATSLLADAPAPPAAAVSPAPPAPAAAPAAPAEAPQAPVAEAPAEAKAEGAPEQYADFTVDEGVVLDTELLDDLKGIAKESNLPQATAQKLVDLGVKMQAKQHAEWQKQIGEWADAVKNDKDFGGPKLAENLAIARKAIDLGPPELKELLNSTGLGNHPAVVRWAHSIGKALSEDRFVAGSPSAKPPTDMAERLYGKPSNAA